MTRKEALVLRARESNEEYRPTETEAASAPRWLPVAVVGVALVSFVGLAWYAYHAGSRSVKEEDIVLIEADKAPMKEKPEDPGGMKFPHQDKTIFDAISANPNAVQQGEQVMPAPEEPMNRDQVQAAGDTSTWVNDKLKADAGAASDAAVIQPAIPAMPELAAPVQAVLPGGPLTQPAAPNAQIAAAMPAAGTPAPSAEAPAQPAPVETLPMQDAAPTTVPVVTVPSAPAPVDLKPAPKTAVKATDEAIKKPATAEKPKAKPAPAAAGKGNVQLGSYKSEAEAKGAWKAMQKKHSELALLTGSVMKADLGAKGVFYRLRVSVPNPKDFCAGLAAKKQACLPVK